MVPPTGRACGAGTPSPRRSTTRERKVLRAWATREAAGVHAIPRGRGGHARRGADLGRLVPHDAPHQGVVIEVEPLEEVWLDDLLHGAGERAVLLVLDQVTDPHNVGAILRSAAAFGAIGIVTQDRHSPPESGVVAKAASGALERVPWARVVNLARALEEIGEAGFWRIGLAGDAETELKDALGPPRVALVLGAEGAGAAGPTRASIATRSRGCRSATRWKASTSPTRPRSRFTRRARLMVRTSESIRRACRGARRAASRRLRAWSSNTACPSRATASAGAHTLLRTIVGQQVSVAAARSMWAKLEAAFGSPPDLNLLLAATDEELRAAGMSRQKSGYIRSLAELVISGELDLDNLPGDDEEAIALLTKIKGIGRWSAEIYLLFAEGRRRHLSRRRPRRAGRDSAG